MATITKDLSEAVAALSRGEVVAYPTETFYGLGVDATNPDALHRLLSLKIRPPFKPFPVLLPETNVLSSYVSPILPEAQKLIDAYWPGPLTIVMASTGLPKELSNRNGGVGFRITAHPLAQELVATFGTCITTTSANPSGRRSASTASEVARYFHNADLCVLDGGPTPGGQASTVVEVLENEPIQLHRQGPVSMTEIQQTISKSS